MTDTLSDTPEAPIPLWKRLLPLGVIAVALGLFFALGGRPFGDVSSPLLLLNLDPISSTAGPVYPYEGDSKAATAAAAFS